MKNNTIETRFFYVRQLWEKFTQGENIDIDSLPNYVYRSWVQCREKGIDSRSSSELTFYQTKNIQAELEKNKELLVAADPVLKLLLFSAVEHHFVLMLTSADGVIMHISGEVELLSEQERAYNSLGITIKKEFFNTRATTICLQEGRAISLCGSEHYLEAYHDSLCYAAPIFNHRNEVIACVSLASKVANFRPQTLSMLSVAAENITNHLYKRYLDQSKDYMNSLVFSILQEQSEGVVALTKNNTISYVNQRAAQIFSDNSSDIVGLNIKQFLAPSTVYELENAIQKNKKNPISLETIKKTNEFRYICKVQPLFDSHKEQIGTTLFMSSEKQILQGINHVAGNRAHIHFSDIQGSSLQITKCKELAQKVAKNASRILLTGESGTGKELFAQAIHNAGPRAAQPFVAISCASIPRDLVEAELFGYVPGAFTGSNKNGGIGKFELANGGTLFLDEIASLPLESQAKFLRALQQGEITRIGGKSPIKVDVHVISATNISLREMVQRREFREDLYYRLNSVEILIPPLRERRGDVELLIKYFISNYNKTRNRNVKITEEWLLPMLGHTWAGNVRELEHACEYSMIICEDDKLEEQHLPDEILQNTSKRTHKKIFLENNNDFDDIEYILKKWLCNALELCKGNIVDVSKKSGIPRTTLYRKLKKFNIDINDFRERKK